jgi:hypothetical protein
MSTTYDENTADVVTTLEIVRIALTDWDIRELVLDQMDMSDEEASRILSKVNEGLEGIREPQG